MKLVAVTRILNEDDIVEAFVRHHQAAVDHHVLLDNGSTDRTVEILTALHGEGVPLTLLQAHSVSFSEAQHLTTLYRYAAIALQADWVLPLDADEFLDTRAAFTDLRTTLAAVPAATLALHVPLILYLNAAEDDAAELTVPKRLVRRGAVQQDVFKIIVRGGPAAPRIDIAPGSHGAALDGRPCAIQAQTAFRLAHYPRRSAWQHMAKFLIGRLKAVAAGRAVLDAQHADHYAPLLATLKERPHDLLYNRGFVEATNPGVETIIDPIQYGGMPLRYTELSDDRMKAVRVLAAYAEALAAQHARLIDENTAVRALVDGWAAEIKRLL
jgi:hypothetical protein